MDLVKKIGVFALAIVVILTVVAVVSSFDSREGNIKEGDKSLELSLGKNNVTVSEEIFVRDFAALNGNIEAVSYFDEGANLTVGYVNVFGGVGKNFVMGTKTIYEVIVRNDALIKLT